MKRENLFGASERLPPPASLSAATWPQFKAASYNFVLREGKQSLSSAHFVFRPHYCPAVVSAFSLVFLPKCGQTKCWNFVLTEIYIRDAGFVAGRAPL